MLIADGIETADLALYLKKEKTIVVADFHIGYEEALNKKGILVPRFQFKDIMKRLEKILKKTKPHTIVINGDLKHEFGTISEQEWRETLGVLDFLSEHCKKIILIKGNHDTILGPIARKRNVDIVESYETYGIFVTHGHKIVKTSKKTKTIIIAHEHPAVSLREGSRKEIFKCFLKGRYKNKTLIVQPSFNLVTEGTDVVSEKLLSPYLHQDLAGFDVYVVANKVYNFGKLKNIL